MITEEGLTKSCFIGNFVCMLCRIRQIDCFYIKHPVKILNDNSQNTFCNICPGLYGKKRKFSKGFFNFKKF